MSAPRMTRAHFVMVAGVLSDARVYAETPAELEALDRLSRTFAGELARTNGAFNRSRFLDAAGVAP